jgi:hypothetical protein
MCLGGKVPHDMDKLLESIPGLPADYLQRLQAVRKKEVSCEGAKN